MPTVAGGFGISKRVGFAWGLRRFFRSLLNIMSSKCSAHILRFLYKYSASFFSRSLRLQSTTHSFDLKTPNYKFSIKLWDRFKSNIFVFWEKNITYLCLSRGKRKKQSSGCECLLLEQFTAEQNVRPPPFPLDFFTVFAICSSDFKAVNELCLSRVAVWQDSTWWEIGTGWGLGRIRNYYFIDELLFSMQYN